MIPSHWVLGYSSGTAGSIAAYGKIAMSGRQLQHQVTSIRASLEGTGCKLWCFYGDVPGGVERCQLRLAYRP
jgi:hypothetical protein